MLDKLEQVAKAVFDEINIEFSPAYPVTLLYVPTFDLERLGELQVIVCPVGEVRSVLTRGQVQYQLTVQIGLHKKLDPNQPKESQVNELLRIVNQYKQCFQLRPLNQCDAQWLAMENDPTYSTVHLNEDGTFLSVLSLIYVA